jgi:transposase
VLKYMDRSTIHYLRQKGWTKTQIAAFVGHHRDTIARVLKEPVDQQPIVRPREPLASTFAEQIERWLDDGLSVRRMIELARADGARPFTGSDVAFYNYVRPLRQARRTLPVQVVVRFEGLPGELLQIDWGEQRQMKFTQVGLAGQTRYFFAARLKYSRWMWARFGKDMQSETLLRCLIACLLDLGGVPWVVTSDNPKTITVGRDAQHQPILHPAYQQLATEFGFHPSLCTPAAAQQKAWVSHCTSLGCLGDNFAA